MQRHYQSSCLSTNRPDCREMSPAGPAAAQLNDRHIPLAAPPDTTTASGHSATGNPISLAPVHAHAQSPKLHVLLVHGTTWYIVTVLRPNVADVAASGVLQHAHVYILCHSAARDIVEAHHQKRTSGSLLVYAVSVPSAARRGTSY